ncbi:MAG TPA: 4-(cytidine 5'-diphospho)-2-C-methyl-D-erythritol kinase [Pyrinomonadaceae bacterium]|nr:4-(cytidine 5'-diphospho)-2-C-methyl-D-erythritol kinase [Pyrinomonadaceae bacterium]
MSISALTLPAFAKINLTLRVLDKGADGYHDLDTIFQTVSLHDTIQMSPMDQPHIILSCSDRSLSLGEDNLVIRAARALQDGRASNKGARIHLEKRIPLQAGLGGGSSDAAVTLLGLIRLWELSPTKEDLLEIASQLGADVPLFLLGGTARGTGIGDKLEPLADGAEKFLLIVKPNANVKTSDAYKALDERSLTSHNSKTILSTSRRSQVFDKADLASLINDFEVVAFDLAPEIRRAKAALLKAGANAALLAGSGSAVFGILDSEDAQRRAIQAIELEAGWRVFPCRMIGRSTYRNEMGPAGENFALLFGR